jgi:hypothetical protein
MDSKGKILLRSFTGAVSSRGLAPTVDTGEERGRGDTLGGRIINRSHRAAPRTSSIGKPFRRRFSAGESFAEAIAAQNQAVFGAGIPHAPGNQERAGMTPVKSAR